MKKVFSIILSAITFGALGFVGGSLYTKKKWQAIADREIESMKAQSKNHEKWLKEKYGIPEKEGKKPESKDSKKIVIPKKNSGLGNPNATVIPKATPKEENLKTDYTKYNQETPAIDPDKVVIDKDEIDVSVFEQTTLYYYKDGIIADEFGNIVDNFITCIGPISDWDKYFVDGKDTIYIRNTKENIDYTIIKCDTTWKSIASGDQKDSLLDIDAENDDDEDDEYDNRY